MHTADPLHYIRRAPREHTANVDAYRAHALPVGTPAGPDARPRVHIDATGIDPEVWQRLVLLHPERYHFWQVPIPILLRAAYAAHQDGADPKVADRIDTMLEDAIPRTHMSFDCDTCERAVVVDVSQPAPDLGTTKALVWFILGLDRENTRASWLRWSLVNHAHAHEAE